jgi:uncharacterized protein (DUF302 family)
VPTFARSRFSHLETLEQLSRAIADAGNTIFATIDQARAAAQSGTSLRPTTLVLFGNPRAGTSLMNASPEIALDLPLKLLVYEENGTVTVAYTPASEIAVRYGIAPTSASIVAMDRTLENLVRGVSDP